MKLYRVFLNLLLLTLASIGLTQEDVEPHFGDDVIVLTPGWEATNAPDAEVYLISNLSPFGHYAAVAQTIAYPDSIIADPMGYVVWDVSSTPPVIIKSERTSDFVQSFAFSSDEQFFALLGAIPSPK